MPSWASQLRELVYKVFSYLKRESYAICVCVCIHQTPQIFSISYTSCVYNALRKGKVTPVLC
jgi:hypothetical protein